MRKKDLDKRRALLLGATASCIREVGIASVNKVAVSIVNG